MKVYSATAKSDKSGVVTLQEARRVAQLVKGSRPTGKFVLVKSKKYKELHDRYLGEIVHTTSPSSKGHASSAERSSSKTAGARPAAKKK